MTAMPSIKEDAPVVLEERDRGVLRLTLNRPQARNALSAALMSAVLEALGRAAREPRARVVVIAGAGPAFCAGHDLRELRTDQRRDTYERFFAQCSELMQAIGLVNRVVPREGLRDAADGLAREIAGKSALTVAIGKEAFYRQAELDLAAAYRYAAEVMTTNMLAGDAGEGIDAFLAKRAPVWHDR